MVLGGPATASGPTPPQGVLGRCDGPRGSCGGPTSVARPVRPPAATEVTLGAVAAPLTSGAPRRRTVLQATFYAAVDSCPMVLALSCIWQARTAASTKGTYRAAVPLYEGVCDKVRMVPWLPTQDTLKRFAGYLRVSGAFAGPATYWWTIVDESCERRCDFRLDRAWAKGVVVGLEPDLRPREQAAPVTAPIWRRLGAAAHTPVDFITVLGLAGALFTLARADSFLTLGPEDIRDLGPDRVRVVLSRLKGERRQQVLGPVFKRLPTATGEFHPIWTPQGVIPLCPVEAFCLLRARAVREGAACVAQCGLDQMLIRRLSHLCACAQVPQQNPGRNRRLFTAHSTRVAGVYYLLRAGSPEMVLSVLANWSSNQIKQLANRLALDPSFILPWPFFNLLAHAMYSGSTAPPPPKRRRVACG